MLNEATTPDPHWRHPAEFMDGDLDHDDGDDMIDVQGLGRIPVDCIRVLLSMLIPSRGSGPVRWKTALGRLLALAHAVNFESVRAIPLTEIAEQIGLSRASLSLMNVRLRDAGGLDCRNGKSNAARESYSRSASAVWQARRERVGRSEGESVATRHKQTSCERTAR